MGPEPSSRTWAVVSAVALLIGGVVAAAYGGCRAAAFPRDLDRRAPALASAPPVDGDTGPRLARRVVIAIVDGLRADAAARMPALTALAARGVAPGGRAQYPTYSIPAYVTLLTGVPPAASGVRTNRFGGTTTLDTVMARARHAGLGTAYAGDYDPVPRLFLRPRAAEDALHVDAPEALDDYDPETAAHAGHQPARGDFDEAHYAPWAGGLWEAAGRALAGDAALVVVLVGVVDVAGHDHGAASDAYRAAVQHADLAIARLAATLDLSRDALIVVADHGHTDRGGHGGLEPEVVDVPLVVAGAGVTPGAVVDGPWPLTDVAPTAARLLGLAPPGHALGWSRVDALALDPATRARLAIDDTARVVRNDAIAGAERARARAIAASRRDGRQAALLVAGAILLIVVTWAVQLRGVRFDWRSLAIGVPAFFGVYYLLIATLGQRFSPSLVPARAHIATELVTYGVAAMVLQLIAGWLALRRHRRVADRLAAANGIALVGLIVALVPAALVWVQHPAPYAELPGPQMLVLIPAVAICVACYVLGTTVTLIVELIVFAARAADPRADATPSAARLPVATALRREVPSP